MVLFLFIAVYPILISPTSNLNDSFGDFFAEFIYFKLVPIIFTLALIILTYIWSKKLLDGWWTLLPPFLLTFSPIILNQYYSVLQHTTKKFLSIILFEPHTHTTDIAAAFFYAIAIYYLMNFFSKPNKLNLFLTGLYFGLTQLTQFPAFIIIPYFLILISIFYIASVKRDWAATEPPARLKRFGLRGFKYFRSIIVIFIIGYLFAYIGYFINEAFSLQPLCYRCGPQNPIHTYFYRILTESKANSYPPITFLLKTYWPFLILIGFAFIYNIIGMIKSFRNFKFKGFFDYLGTSFPEFSMIVFIAIYSFFIIFFSSGISAEKLIPILPMVYILTASGLKRFWMNKL